jgi:hypothetical protein
MDKESISRRISIEILLKAYINDSKPSPLDFGTLFKLLKNIDCKNPLIFKEIMKKYDYFYDKIKMNKIHLNYFINIGQQGKIDFNVEPVWKKISGSIGTLKIKDKTNIFCNLVMSNYSNLKEIRYLITLFRLPVIMGSNLIELYTFLLCFYKLSSSQKGKMKFEIEVIDINKRLLT